MGYSPWDHKELNTTEQLNTYTHSPILSTFEPYIIPENFKILTLFSLCFDCYRIKLEVSNLKINRKSSGIWQCSSIFLHKILVKN